MTAPASGGRIVTLTPGKPGVMLTEYAGGEDNPLFIINTDPAGGRVYIGADASISPANGVPLDPGTSLPWTYAGQVWAIADPAAAGTISITLTTAISDWTPSPAAIAAEVAAQLLAAGVPNVLTGAQFAAGDSILAGGNKSYAIGGYATLNMIIRGDTAGAAGIVDLAQSFAGGPTMQDDSVGVSTFTNSPFAIAVVGDTLKITNLTAGNILVWGVGTNRVARKRFDRTYAPQTGQEWSLTQIWAPGTVQLTTANFSQGLQGPCYLDAFVGGAVITGRFEVVTRNLADPFTLTDTVNMYTAASGGRRYQATVALPADLVLGVQFVCNTGEGGNARAVRATLIPYDY